MALYNSIDELIGGTPLLRLSKFEKKHNLAAAVYAKLEFFNPAGSVKDRAAKAMLECSHVGSFGYLLVFEFFIYKYSIR